MTSPAIPVVRLTTPGDIVAALPVLVGFHPQESLVAVSLRGPRRRVGLTSRADLLNPEYDDLLAAQVVEALLRDQADRVILVVVTEQPDDLPRRELVRRLAELLVGAGVEVAEALLSRGGRWWSYLCDGPCCPAGGTPVPSTDDSPARAAAALAGASILPDRDALVALLRPAEGPAAQALRAVQDEQRDAAADLLQRVGVDALRRQTLKLLDDLEERFRAPLPRIDDAHAAALTAALASIPVRDAVLRVIARRERRDALEDLLVAVTRLALPPHDAPVATVTAVAAYLNGHGALAWVALQRAVDTDPDYSLAHLLSNALVHAVPPPLLAEAFAGARPDHRAVSGAAERTSRRGAGARGRRGGGRRGSRRAPTR